MFADIYRYEPESRGALGRARLARQTMSDVVGGAMKERLPFFDMLRQDLGYGLRRLRINPTLTIAAVLTLAVGIGAVSSIYSFVYGMVLNPLPYPDVDRVVAIGEVSPRIGLNGEGWIHGAELQQLEQLDSIESVSAMSLFLVTMTGDGDPTEVVGWRATPGFFAVAGVRPLIGRSFTGSAADTDTVVLGYSFWQRRFGGDRDVVGHSLRFGDRNLTVIGVMPRGAEFPMGTDVWVPLELTPEQAASYGGQGPGSSISVRTIARLAPGATIDQLRAELAPVAEAAAEAAPEAHENRRFAVEPILANMTINTRQAFGFLMGAAVFLLLLVCGNVANMQLAQAAARRDELAMRQALGAPRGRLVRQLLTESVALALLGAIAGTGLAFWSASGLRTVLGQERWRLYFAGVENVGINPAVLAFTAALALGSVILFGLAPALRGSRVDLNEVLNQSLGHGRRRGNRLRRSLVVLEVALSMVLLVGAGLMASGINAFARFDPGIDTGVLAVRLRLPATGYEEPAQRQQFFEQTLSDAAAIPGVRSAALADRLPATQASRGVPVSAEPTSADDPTETRAERHEVGGDYFDTLGIALLQGRGFEPADFEPADAGPTPVIVSAALADRLWPDGPPVGRRLRTGDEQPWLTVVGVAADVAVAWSDPRPSPSFYLPTGPSRGGSMNLLLSARGDTGGIMAALRDRIWSLDDAVVVFAPESIAENIDSLAGPTRSMSRLVTGMALIALIVCLSGVYALVAHYTGQRRREIGVRMALGARDKQIVRMLVGHGLRTTGVGLLIGLLLAFGLASLMAGFMAGSRMAGILPVDSSVFLTLGAGMLLLAALASWLPARRATHMDPAVTLRAE
jgi:putative ABC transport system permease protein